MLAFCVGPFIRVLQPKPSGIYRRAGQAFDEPLSERQACKERAHRNDVGELKSVAKAGHPNRQQLLRALFSHDCKSDEINLRVMLSQMLRELALPADRHFRDFGAAREDKNRSSARL